MGENTWRRSNAKLKAVQAEFRRRLHESLSAASTHLRSAGTHLRTLVHGQVLYGGTPANKRIRERGSRAVVWSADARVWDLSGLRLLRIVVGSGVRFEIFAGGPGNDPDQITIIVEMEFTVRLGDVSSSVDPFNMESLAPALRLLDREVASITATRDGSLSLQFTDGAELLIGKNPEYTSWETHGSGALDSASMLCEGGSPWGDW